MKNMNLYKPLFFNYHVVSSSPSSSSSSSSSSMISPVGFLREPIPVLKHDAGLADDWSFREQAILDDALIKFGEEAGMVKYVKIAALLPEKNVRDVALRCRWMAKKENVKRRKIEENYAAKEIQSRKMADSSAKENMHLVPSNNIAVDSFMSHPAQHNNRFSYEVHALDSATQHLLQENVQVLNQISANLARYKLQDNIELFLKTSNNITSILHSMSQMPGIMSQMPSLPMSINEDVVDSILQISGQAPIYETTSGISLIRQSR